MIEVDARGLRCPMPVLKARKALEPLQPGMRITVLATDPMAKLDMAHFCAEAGHRLIEQAEQDQTHRFVIERGDRPACLQSGTSE